MYCTNCREHTHSSFLYQNAKSQGEKCNVCLFTKFTVFKKDKRIVIVNDEKGFIYTWNGKRQCMG